METVYKTLWAGIYKVMTTTFILREHDHNNYLYRVKDEELLSIKD